VTSVKQAESLLACGEVVLKNGSKTKHFELAFEQAG